MNHEAIHRALVGNELTHRIISERFGLDADPAVLERVAALYAMRPAWARAATLPIDSLILYDMVRCLRPAHVLEVGVASGLGTMMLLASLNDHGIPLTDDAGRAAVQSFDVLDHVPWDESTPIGAAVGEVMPELARGVRFNLKKTALDARAELAGLGARLAFVDGSHKHPWALVDVVALAEAMTDDAWFILHDIAIVERALTDAIKFGTDRRTYGARAAQWLFEFWTGPKFRGVGAGGNVGMIQITPGFDWSSLAPLAELPWETPIPDAARALLADRIGERHVAIGEQRAREIFEQRRAVAAEA